MTNENPEFFICTRRKEKCESTPTHSIHYCFVVFSLSSETLWAGNYILIITLLIRHHMMNHQAVRFVCFIVPLLLHL